MERARIHSGEGKGEMKRRGDGKRRRGGVKGRVKHGVAEGYQVKQNQCRAEPVHMNSYEPH